MKITSANHIHAHLMAQGLSCRAWALMMGYRPRTVQRYVQLYAPDQSRIPRSGSKAEKIMTDLYAYIGYVQDQGDDHGA